MRGLLLFPLAIAMPGYQATLPSYNDADCFGPFGHEECVGLGAYNNNAFGRAFRGHVTVADRAKGIASGWTALCREDQYASDGRINGEVFGDACCRYEEYKERGKPAVMEPFFPSNAALKDELHRTHSVANSQACTQGETENISPIITYRPNGISIDWSARAGRCACSGVATKDDGEEILAIGAVVIVCDITAESVIELIIEGPRDFSSTFPITLDADSITGATGEDFDCTAVEEIDITQHEKPEVGSVIVEYIMVPAVALVALVIGAALDPLKKSGKFQNPLILLPVVACIIVTIILSKARYMDMQLPEGLATGRAIAKGAVLALSLNLLFSLRRFHVGSILHKPSEQIIFPLHMLCGHITFVLIIVHGATMMVNDTSSMTGLLALITVTVMWVGIWFGNAFSYAIFRLSHNLAPVFVFLVILHLIDRSDGQGGFDWGPTIIVLVPLVLRVIEYVMDAANFCSGSTVVAQSIDEKYVKLSFVNKKTAFKPGQYVKLRVSSLSQASHPFSCIPDKLAYETSKDFSHFELVCAASGAFTKGLHDLKEQSCVVFGPYGGPTWAGTDVSVAFIAGGIGITPVTSLALAVPNGQKKYLYWAHNSTKLYEEFRPRFPQFNRDDIKDGTSKDRDAQPKLDDFMAGVHADCPDVIFFVCGPVKMAKAAEVWAAKNNARIHVELFSFFPQH